jgi:RNase P protein component
MSGLTNEYVEQIGKKILGRSFLGTFPCDIQPNVKNKKEFSIIFNLSKHNTKGTHFIAVYADKENIFYFDPLGHKCDNNDILNFLEKNRRKRQLRAKFRKIQSCESIFCGFFCLAFLLSRKRKLPMSKFFKNFQKTNLKQNDQNVINFIQKHLTYIF